MLHTSTYCLELCRRHWGWIRILVCKKAALLILQIKPFWSSKLSDSWLDSVKGRVGQREENEQTCYVHETQAQRDPCWQDGVIHGHRCRYITHLTPQSFFHICLNDKNIAHFPHKQFGINFFLLKTALTHPHRTVCTRTAVWWGKQLKFPSIKFRKNKNANVFEFAFCRSKADEPTSTVPSTT